MLEQLGGLGEDMDANPAHWVEKAEAAFYLSVFTIFLFTVSLTSSLLFCHENISTVQKQHKLD